MDRYAITNEQLARFMATTGYATVVERPLKPTASRGTPPKNLTRVDNPGL
jgi:hypothetical protein